MKQLLLSLLFFLPLSLSATPEEIKTTDTLGYNINGDPVFRAADKVTVVSLWASWCPYCKQILPVLESVQRQAGKDNISVIIINSRENGTALERKRTYRKYAKHFKKHSLNAQFIYDKKNRLYKSFEKPGFPYTLIIDKNGKVIFDMQGFHKSKEKSLITVINEQLAIASNKNKV